MVTCIVCHVVCMLTDGTALKVSFLHSHQYASIRKKPGSASVVSLWSAHIVRESFARTLCLILQNTFFFPPKSSETLVPVFTYTPYTLLLHAHPWYQTAMNHKQLTSSLGLNERHASVGNRIKARFVLFSLSNNNTENQVFACARETTMRTACVLLLHYAASQCTFWQIVWVYRLLLSYLF